MLSLIRTTVALALFCGCTPGVELPPVAVDRSRDELPGHVYLTAIEYLRATSGRFLPTAVDPNLLRSGLTSSLLAERGIIVSEDACAAVLYLKIQSLVTTAPGEYRLTLLHWSRKNMGQTMDFEIDCRGGTCSVAPGLPGAGDYVLGCPANRPAFYESDCQAL
jgi:hypothetical protein